MERFGKLLRFVAVLAGLVLASPVSALAQGWRGSPSGGGHGGGAPMGGYRAAPGGGIPRGAQVGPTGGWRGGYLPGYGGPYPYNRAVPGSAFNGGFGYPGYYWGGPGYWGWNGGARIWISNSWSYPSDYAQSAAGWVWVSGRWNWNGLSWVWLPGHWTPPAGS